MFYFHLLPTDHAAAVESMVRNRLLQSSIKGRWGRRPVNIDSLHSLIAGREGHGHRDSGTQVASLSNPTGEVGGVDELFTLMLDELHHLPTDHAAAVESLVRNRLLQSSIKGRWGRRPVNIDSLHSMSQIHNRRCRR